MAQNFREYLSSRSLPLERLATFCLLDELVATPWVFDVLWDAWPSLDITRDQRPHLAVQLLGGPSPELFLRGSAVFDHITIFEDIIASADMLATHERQVYRAAYLTLRPTLIRGRFGDPPQQTGRALNKNQYLTRFHYITATLTSSEVDAVYNVLGSAAAGYEERGHLEGAHACRKSSRALRLVSRGNLSAPHDKKGDRPLELPIGDFYTLIEYSCQWWPVLKSGFHIVLMRARAAGGSVIPSGDLDGIAGAISALDDLAIHAPGIGSIIATLAILRIMDNRPMGALSLIPIGWTHDAQAGIIALHRKFGRRMYPLDEAYEFLVDVERRDLHSNIDPEADREVPGGLDELWAQVCTKARLRARNELSQRDFFAALDSYKDQVRAAPQIAGEIVAAGVLLEHTDVAYSRALSEAALHLAMMTGNNAMIAYATDGIASHYSDPGQLLARAERFNSRGRVDLAAIAFYDAGILFSKDDSTENSISALERCWTLLRDIRQGSTLMPKNIVPPDDCFLYRVAIAAAKQHVNLGEGARALSYLNEALAVFKLIESGANVSLIRESRFSVDGGKERYRLAAELLICSALCHHTLGDTRSAGQSIAEAKVIADTHRFNAESARARMVQGVVAGVLRGGAPAEAYAPLMESISYAEHARRSYPFERDKVSVLRDFHAPYAWLAEHHIEQERPWEALASLEGLRSRVLLDLLGLSRALPMPATLNTGLSERGLEILGRMRSMAFPGEASGVERTPLGVRNVWAVTLDEFDDWVTAVARDHPSYARIASGRSMSPEDIVAWASRVTHPTAVVFWFTGTDYSYQAVLLAENGYPQPPLIQRVPVSAGWLEACSQQLHDAVARRSDPPAELWDELGRRLIDPVRDHLLRAETVYLCPTQAMHKLPLSALPLGGRPLNIQKEVAVIPTLSVLSALQMIDSGKIRSGQPAVFGPDFIGTAAKIAKLLGTQQFGLPVRGEHTPFSALQAASIVHLICHGHYDDKDPWASGLAYSDGADRAVLTGYDLAQWRLEARLVTLQACDTRRQIVTEAEDTFGLGRFLHIAGAPSVLLADWEVREDISTIFMAAFYRSLLTETPGSASRVGRGNAYRAAMREVYAAAGVQHSFLWAPYTLAGVAD